MKWFYLMYSNWTGSLVLMCGTCADRSVEYGGKIIKKEMHRGYCPVCGG
jgi:hypothetical protein